MWRFATTTRPRESRNGRHQLVEPLPKHRRHRRAASLPSILTWGPFAFYLGLQTLIVAGLPTARLPDSASYLSLSVTGANGRLFTVPLLYWIFPSDPLRICAQVVLAAVAWWILASTVGSYVEDRRISLGVRLILLAIGVCGPVASWNSTILSESVALSLTALVFALWLRYVKSPNLGRLLLLLVVAIFWMFTRSDNLVIGLIVMVVWTVWIVIKRSGILRFALALAMCAICSFGLVVVASQHSVNDVNLAEIVSQRILPNEGYTSWFVEHGMPYSKAIANDANVYPPKPLLDDPRLDNWIRSQGRGVYAKFVLAHPGPQILGWLADLSGEQPSLTVSPPPPIFAQPNPSPSLLSPDANYGRHREVLPEVVQDLLFQQGQIGDVIALAAAASGLAIMSRRKTGHDERLTIPAWALALALVQTAIIWVSAVTELDRLGMVPAVTIRIALWTIVACSLDRLLPVWVSRHQSQTENNLECSVTRAETLDPLEDE
jgi:hypothetical protein